MHANDKIAAFRDPNKTRVGWWCKHAHYLNANFSDRRGTLVKVGDYIGPDFYHDDLAAFTHLRGPLLAMGWTINMTDNWTRCTPPVTPAQLIDRKGIDGMVKRDKFAAALTAAFTWAMQHKPEELRKACEVAG